MRSSAPVVTQGHRQAGRAVKLLLGRALVKRPGDTVELIRTLPLLTYQQFCAGPPQGY